MNRLVEQLDAFKVKCITGEDSILAPRQLVTVEKIRNFIAYGQGTGGRVILPTGIGKTVIFSKFLEAISANNTSKSLIVGPTRIILNQNKGRFDEFTSLIAGTYHMHEKNLNHQVTATTYASLIRIVRSGVINPLDYSTLILDEGHRALGEETLAAINAFKNAIKIGFTATPEFNDEKSLANLLPHLIDEMTVREAIDANLLAGLKVYVIPTSVSMDNIETRGVDYSEVSLTKAINTAERNKFIANLWLDERFHKKLTVVYGASRKHAKDLEVVFQEVGAKTGYLDCYCDDDEREKILEKFKNREIDVLLNKQVLVEGFDESEAEVCFNAAPTYSKVVAEQRGGRILRRSKKKDSKIGVIVEILDDFSENPNTPVLFSEIAGAAEILSPSNIKEIRTRKVNGFSPSKGEVKPRNPKVIDDPTAIMNLTNKNKRQRFTKMFQFAPKGWVHARRLSHELHVRENEIRLFAEKHAMSHPDWFKKYLTPRDVIMIYYHPYLVDLVRKEYSSKLRNMITPLSYADKHLIPVKRAEKLLEGADDTSQHKAIKFDDVSYFYEKEHGQIIKDEIHRERELEEQQILAAEEEFWTDDDRSDEERERDYWLNFESITSESLNIDDEATFEPDPLLHHEDTIQFDEDLHEPAFDCDEPSMILTSRMRNKVRNYVHLLPINFINVIEPYFFDEDVETLADIARRLKVSSTRVGQVYMDGIRYLKRRSRLIVLWDYEEVDDEYLRNQCGWIADKENFFSYHPGVVEFIKVQTYKYQHQRCFCFPVV